MLGFLRKDFYMLYGAYKKNLLLVFLLYAALVLVMKNTFLLAILIWLMAFYGLICAPTRWCCRPTSHTHTS